jgi:hypothetical protein
MKTCKDCGLSKKKEEFYLLGGGSTYYRPECKLCSSIRKAKYVAKNPEKEKRKNKNKNLLKNYGITIEIYNQQFETQNGCCAICGKHQSLLKKSLAVDHNHVTGKIRKLLCNNCNILLGMAEDSPALLENAITYLQENL